MFIVIKRHRCKRPGHGRETREAFQPHLDIRITKGSFPNTGAFTPSPSPHQLTQRYDWPLLWCSPLVGLIYSESWKNVLECAQLQRLTWSCCMPCLCTEGPIPNSVLIPLLSRYFQDWVSCLTSLFASDTTQDLHLMVSHSHDPFTSLCAL